MDATASGGGNALSGGTIPPEATFPSFYESTLAAAALLLLLLAWFYFLFLASSGAISRFSFSRILRSTSIFLIVKDTTERPTCTAIV